jgi:hypothetical protein
VSISDRELAQTAEIGIVEDVMTSIKLLPGVGYSGMFNALPSIRGGEPGDLTAVFDGFYVESPYHWGGGVSIFDPRMVKSAKLSHGVFSARYGHTISGLLEITARKPDPQEFEAELGFSSSAANLNLSYPLWGKGGVMAMGKVTYWDPFVAAAKLFVEEAQYIRVAPYIRSAAVSAHYRFTPEVEATLNAFIGGDGIGVTYDNQSDDNGVRSKSDITFDWDNSTGFLIGGVTFNPVSSMVLKGTAGVGFHNAEIDGYMRNDIQVKYSKQFLDDYGTFLDALKPDHGDSYQFAEDTFDITGTTSTANVQARADLDWEFGKGFLFAFGVQELYARWEDASDIHAYIEQRAKSVPPNLLPSGIPAELIPPNLYLHFPIDYKIDVLNQGFTTSTYAAAEYTGFGGFLGAELGLRIDHLAFLGNGFTIQTYPAFNPRLNVDFNLLKDYGLVETLTATVGTGLFSSVNDAITLIEDRYGIGDFEMKQNRSWTSLIGGKIDFINGFSFTIEGYFKYMFDRAYMYGNINPGSTEAVYKFNGEGISAGFDFMLQKFESRYWDGWISYSFNYARYRNPDGNPDSSTASDWYYPSFHRFHNLNVIVNIKPIPRFNIAVHFGLASGRPKTKVGSIETYPVIIYDENSSANGTLIEKWKRTSVYSDDERTTWSVPLDIKLSWYFFNPQGKTQGELYFAVENLASLVYKAQANTSFNAYTGKEDTGSDAASYEMPLPLPSIGFKWTY